MKYFLFIFFVSTYFVTAQQIQVLDCDSEEPLQNVTVYSNGGKVYAHTDKNGNVDISKFDDNDLIFFYHLAYEDFEILKKDILGIILLCKKSEQLTEVILSASKSKEKRSRIAESVSVISQAEVQKLSPQTSADLLGNLRGVKIQKSQSGGGSPVLRGMEANRILLVIDGVRMNNAIYRMGHLQNSITVSPNILERTEVIYGPSSVIYGSDALGGVIHYYTKNPKLAPKFKTNTSFYSRYSSVNNEFSNSINISLKNKKWATFTSISHNRYGNLKMGKNRKHGFLNWGKVDEFSNNSENYYNPSPLKNKKPLLQPNTKYNQTDILQKILIPISAKTEALFNFQYSTSSNIYRFDKLTEYSRGKLKFAEWHYGPQKRLLLSSQLKIQPKKKWLKKGTITLAYQNIKESRIQRKFNSLKRSYRNENVDVFSLNGDFFVPVNSNKKRIFSYGFEATHNIVNSKAYGKTLLIKNNSTIQFDNQKDFSVSSRYPDGGGTYSSGAFYLNYRQDLNRKSILNTGIRYSYTQLSAKWIDESFIKLPKKEITLNNSAVTATLGYVYNPTKNWQFNAVASSGFRSPNLDDVGKIREKSGKVTMPNIYLKPEYAYNFETGIIKYFNNKRFRTTLTAHYTLLNNYISRDYLLNNHQKTTVIYDDEKATAIANINKGNAYIIGGTAGFKGILSDNMFVKGFATYTKGRTYDTQQPLSSIPPLFGRLDIGYTNDIFDIIGYWKFNARKKLSDTNLIEGIDNIHQTPTNKITNKYYGTPAWNTFNIRTKYRVLDNVSVFLLFENIFDTHYKEFASSISSGGFNSSISVFFEF